MKKRIIMIIAVFFISAIYIYSQTLHLYSQKDNDLIYLGCLNCNDYSSKSIWNEYGTFGSSYNSKSIWNEYGAYGNEYSSDSPWNEYASNPPVLLDDNGNFYGYFTINKYKNKRAEFELALVLYKYYDLIREDIPKWYEKIFE
jgi:hypothetical protein